MKFRDWVLVEAEDPEPDNPFSPFFEKRYHANLVVTHVPDNRHPTLEMLEAAGCISTTRGAPGTDRHFTVVDPAKLDSSLVRELRQWEGPKLTWSELSKRAGAPIRLGAHRSSTPEESDSASPETPRQGEPSNNGQPQCPGAAPDNLRSRAQFARFMWNQIESLLDVTYGGNVAIVSEESDLHYIALCHDLRSLLEQPEMDELRREFPSGLPETLHAGYADGMCDVWDEMSAGLQRFTGAILRFLITHTSGEGLDEAMLSQLGEPIQELVAKLTRQKAAYFQRWVRHPEKVLGRAADRKGQGNQPSGGGAKAALPTGVEPPSEPRSDAGDNAWFGFYHAMLNAGFKCTLADIAGKTGFSEGYVKQKHAAWLEEHPDMKGARES